MYKTLTLTNNSKVRYYDGHCNTFSLKAGDPDDNGGTCPFATKGKGGCAECCYAKNLRKAYKGYATVEDKNTELVKNLHGEELYQLLKNTVIKFLLDGGYDKPYFRLHTSGDFFSEEYVNAWIRVINEFSDVQFWAYTRGFVYVADLAKCKNLTLMLSLDPVNKKEGLETYDKVKEFGNVSVAWMGNDFPEELTDRPTLVCPAVTKKVKPIAKEGACSRCRACVDRTCKDGKIRFVRFPIHR